VTDSPFDARELVGLLADDDRRRVVAALELGATTIDGVRAATGLSVQAAVRAVQRLVDAGLVVRDDDDRSLSLFGAAFALAARAEAERARRSAEHDDEPDTVARVLRVFVSDGRLRSVPTVRTKRVVVLDWIAQRFEPDGAIPRLQSTRCSPRYIRIRPRCAAISSTKASWHASTASTGVRAGRSTPSS